MGTAGAKVVVASKLPMAFEMQACKPMVQHVKNGQNAWDETVYVKEGPMVVINGTSYPNGQVPAGMPEKPAMAFGAALTFDVDKDLFDAWYEQNKNSPMVRNGLVFASEKHDGVKGKAKDHKDQLSGLEPLKPDTDRRMPKKISSRVTGGGAPAGAE